MKNCCSAQELFKQLHKLQDDQNSQQDALMNRIEELINLKIDFAKLDQQLTQKKLYEASAKKIQKPRNQLQHRKTYTNSLPGDESPKEVDDEEEGLPGQNVINIAELKGASSSEAYSSNAKPASSLVSIQQREKTDLSDNSMPGARRKSGNSQMMSKTGKNQQLLPPLTNVGMRKLTTDGYQTIPRPPSERDMPPVVGRKSVSIIKGSRRNLDVNIFSYNKDGQTPGGISRNSIVSMLGKSERGGTRNSQLFKNRPSGESPLKLKRAASVENIVQNQRQMPALKVDLSLTQAAKELLVYFLQYLASTNQSLQGMDSVKRVLVKVIQVVKNLDKFKLSGDEQLQSKSRAQLLNHIFRSISGILSNDKLDEELRKEVVALISDERNPQSFASHLKRAIRDQLPSLDSEEGLAASQMVMSCLKVADKLPDQVRTRLIDELFTKFTFFAKTKVRNAEGDEESQQQQKMPAKRTLDLVRIFKAPNKHMLLLVLSHLLSREDFQSLRRSSPKYIAEKQKDEKQAPTPQIGSSNTGRLLISDRQVGDIMSVCLKAVGHFFNNQKSFANLVIYLKLAFRIFACVGADGAQTILGQRTLAEFIVYFLMNSFNANQAQKRPLIDRSQFALFLEMCYEALQTIVHDVQLLEQLALTAGTLEQAKHLQKKAQSDRLVLQQVLDTITLFSCQLSGQNEAMYDMLRSQLAETSMSQAANQRPPPRAGTVVAKQVGLAIPNLTKSVSAATHLQAHLDIDALFRRIRDMKVESIIIAMVLKIMRLEQTSIKNLVAFKSSIKGQSQAAQLPLPPLISLRYISNVVSFMHNQQFEQQAAESQLQVRHSNSSFMPQSLRQMDNSHGIEEKLNNERFVRLDNGAVGDVNQRFQSLLQLILLLVRSFLKLHRELNFECDDLNTAIERQMTQDLRLLQSKVFQSVNLIRPISEPLTSPGATFALQLGAVPSEQEAQPGDWQSRSECQFASVLHAFSSLVLGDFAQFQARDVINQQHLSVKAQQFAADNLEQLILEPLSKVLRRVHFMTLLPVCLRTLSELVCLRSANGPAGVGNRAAQLSLLDFGLELMTFQQNEANQDLLKEYLVKQKQHDLFEEKRQFALLLDCMHTLMHSQTEEKSVLVENGRAVQLWTQVMIFAHRRRENENFIRPQMARLAAITPCIVLDQDLSNKSKSLQQMIGDAEEFIKERRSLLERYPQLLQSIGQQVTFRRAEMEAMHSQTGTESFSPSKSEFIKKIAHAKEVAETTRNAKNQKNKQAEEDKDNQDGLGGPDGADSTLEDSELAKHMLNSTELTFLQMFLTITESRLFYFKQLLDKGLQVQVANKTLRPFNFFESILSVFNVSSTNGSEVNLLQQLEYVARVAIQEYIKLIAGLSRSRSAHRLHHCSTFASSIIQDDLAFIVKARMHTNLGVSRVAAYSLKKFVEYMPLVLSQFSIFRLMQDSLDVVASSLREEYTSMSSATALPTLGDVVFLPSEYERRRAILQQLRTVYMDLFAVARLTDPDRLAQNFTRYKQLLASQARQSSSASLTLYEKLQATFTTAKLNVLGSTSLNMHDFLEHCMTNPKLITDEIAKLKQNFGPNVFFATDDLFSMDLDTPAAVNPLSPSEFPFRVPDVGKAVFDQVTAESAGRSTSSLFMKTLRYMEKIQLTRQLMYLQKHLPLADILRELSYERLFLREQILTAKSQQTTEEEADALTSHEEQRKQLLNKVERILAKLDKREYILKQIDKMQPLVEELFAKGDALQISALIRQLMSSPEPELLRLLYGQLVKLHVNGNLEMYKHCWQCVQASLWVPCSRLSIDKKSLNSRPRVMDEAELSDSLRESVDKCSQEELLTNFFSQLYQSDYRQLSRPKSGCDIVKQSDSMDQQVHASNCLTYIKLFSEMCINAFTVNAAEEPRIRDLICKTFEQFVRTIAAPVLNKLCHKHGYLEAALKTIKTALRLAHHLKLSALSMSKSLLQSALSMLTKLTCKQRMLKYNLPSPGALFEHLQHLKDIAYLLPKVNSRTRPEEFVATLSRPVDETLFHEISAGTFIISLNTYKQLGVRKNFLRVISVKENTMIVHIKDGYRRRVFFPSDQQQLHVLGSGSGPQEQAMFFNNLILDQLSQIKCSLLANNYIDSRMANLIAPVNYRVPAYELLQKVEQALFSYPKLLLVVLKQQNTASFDSFIDNLTKQYVQASLSSGQRPNQPLKVIDKIFWKQPHVFETLMQQAAVNKDSLARNLAYRKLLVLSRNRSLARMVVFLGYKYSGQHFLHAIALKPFYACSSEVAIFYFSQIFQSLRWDTRNQLTHWLVRRSRELPSIAHNVIWFCRVEKFVDAQPQRKVPLPVEETLDKESQRVEALIFTNMTKTERDYFDTETEFLERITSISGVLKPAQSKDEKKAIIREKLIQYNKDIPDNVYLPTNQRCRVVGIVTTSGMPMQSAARVPIKVDFEVQDYCGPDSDPNLVKSAVGAEGGDQSADLAPKHQHELLLEKLRERQEQMLQDCPLALQPSSEAGSEERTLAALHQQLASLQLTNFPQDIQATVFELVSSDPSLREYAAQIEDYAKMLERGKRRMSQEYMEEKPRKRDLAKDRIAFLNSQPTLKIKMSQYMLQTRANILPDASNRSLLNKGKHSAMHAALSPVDVDPANGRDRYLLAPVRNTGYHRRASSIASMVSQSGALKDEPAVTEGYLDESPLPTGNKKSSPTKNNQASLAWRQLARSALQHVNMPPGLGFSLMPPPSPAAGGLSSKRGFLFMTDGPGARSSRRTIIGQQTQFPTFKPSILRHSRRPSEAGAMAPTAAQQASLEDLTFKGQQSELESSAVQLRRPSQMGQDAFGGGGRVPGGISLFMQFEKTFKAKLQGQLSGQQAQPQVAARAHDDSASDDANDGPRRDPNKPVRIVSCIFKVNDDLRQDILAIQFIKLFQKIFKKNELDLFVAPYKCISNRTGAEQLLGGIIEVVPNSSSRDQIGKAFEIDLHEYFLKKYGSETSLAFQKARQNFIRSLAAYSVVSYILQIKDRHNGNILVDEAGHLIHIDFGFIFDWSPGRDMRFESANFKLTKEFVKILGGSDKAEAYQLYVQRTIQGYLAVRQHYREFMNLVELMIHSGFPCFKPVSLQTLQQRFRMEGDYACQNQFEAAAHMRSVILDAHEKWTTVAYDMIQYKQNRIVY